MKSTQEIFDSFKDMHVLVIGDLMLDKYTYGNAERISPEAPVPIVDVLHEECRLGGAANVALNCRALGAKVSIASVIGVDTAADELLRLLDNAQVNADLLMRSDARTTTIKQRVLVRNQQLLRLDFENTTELLTKDEHAFIDQTMRFIQVQKPQIVIFEDYNKGVLKQHVITKIVEHCNLLNIPTAVDPKKANFLAYKDVTIFKPNLKKIRQ